MRVHNPRERDITQGRFDAGNLKSRRIGRLRMYRIIKDYRDNETLRQSFNRLAEKTFGLDFEDWYRNGFWGDSYNPYSAVVNGEVVANVSVNRTDFLYDGKVLHFLQLGTVMTKEEYRKQGLIREIMGEIEKDAEGKADGIYLFANDSVLDFYPKFGFRKSAEYQYGKKVFNAGGCRLEKVVMDNPAAWERLEDAIGRNLFRGKLDLVRNPGLIMFYVTKFMRESVYFHKGTDTFVIADVEDGRLFLHNVFSAEVKETGQVIEWFGKEIQEAVLGFAPTDAEGYEVTEIREEDCTFFIKGDGLQILEGEKLRIPSLAHA